MDNADEFDLNSRLLDFVSTVAEAMGLELDASVEETADGPRVNLKGEDADALLRHKGEALQALQHITSSVFRHELPENKRLVVDCMDFRRDKDTELRQMALFLAEKAQRTGLDQTLGPLNAYERRIVHMAVAEQGKADTESIGDAAMKTVIISRKRV
jgi:spoIIIJ-associated protein